MNIFSSIKRWKNLMLYLKSTNTRLDILEKNMESIFLREYANDKSFINYKTMFKSHEYTVYSQYGEDGLIFFILSQIGTLNRKFVEFGFGDGKQCNTANLSKNFGWEGLLMDGSSLKVKNASHLYQKYDKVKVKNAFVTAENINQLIEEENITGEIDLLSIDIDGNDYWVWNAINVINPRLVIIEYNASFDKEQALVVQYDPEFSRFEKHKSGWYHSASLKALEILGQKKGYNLIGCNSNGVNAFFVRKDLMKGELQIISSKEAFYPHAKRNEIATLQEQFRTVNKLNLVQI